MTPPSYTISVAGRRLEITGDSGLAAIAPAFSGVVNEIGGHVDATLDVETIADPAGRAPWREFAVGSHPFDDGALAVIHREPSSVETFRPGVQPRLHLAASPEALASGDLRAQPAKHAIATWLTSPTMQLMHAAAIAVEGHGVLLLGVGGRGKSTSALACARAGFTFLGDDLCIVEAGSLDSSVPPRVHGLYATAKLHRDSKERLGVRDWPELGVLSNSKEVVGLPPVIRFERAAPLVAVIGVRAGGQSPGVARPVPSPDAVGLLASTALTGLSIGAGAPAYWLRTATAIARTVPAYELGLSWDLDGVVAAIRSVVEIASARKDH